MGGSRPRPRTASPAQYTQAPALGSPLCDPDEGAIGSTTLDGDRPWTLSGAALRVTIGLPWLAGLTTRDLSLRRTRRASGVNAA